MTDMQELYKTVDQLTSEELKQLYRYILENRVQFVDTENQPSSQQRQLGLHAHLGKAWMSGDFMDELPDEFWLGEE